MRRLNESARGRGGREKVATSNRRLGLRPRLIIGLLLSPSRRSRGASIDLARVGLVRREASEQSEQKRLPTTVNHEFYQPRGSRTAALDEGVRRRLCLDAARGAATAGLGREAGQRATTLRPQSVINRCGQPSLVPPSPPHCPSLRAPFGLHRGSIARRCCCSKSDRFCRCAPARLVANNLRRLSFDAGFCVLSYWSRASVVVVIATTAVVVDGRFARVGSVITAVRRRRRPRAAEKEAWLVRPVQSEHSQRVALEKPFPVSAVYLRVRRRRARSWPCRMSA